MTFNLAGVTKPLASAAQVVASGNRVVLYPKPEESYVENVCTGEKMRLGEQKGVYVFLEAQNKYLYPPQPQLKASELCAFDAISRHFRRAHNQQPA